MRYASFCIIHTFITSMSSHCVLHINQINYSFFFKLHTNTHIFFWFINIHIPHFLHWQILKCHMKIILMCFSGQAADFRGKLSNIHSSKSMRPESNSFSILSKFENHIWLTVKLINYLSKNIQLNTMSAFRFTHLKNPPTLIRWLFLIRSRSMIIIFIWIGHKHI